jgi:hypothetical protein
VHDGGSPRRVTANFGDRKTRISVIANRAYTARRQNDRKSPNDAMRYLKRHLANITYQRLVADLNRLGQAA